MHQFRRLPKKLAQKQTCCRLDLQQEQYCPLLAGTLFVSEHISLALKRVSDGTVDIVVGTHKLLSQDTHFKNLGLLVIDEEHRFGVRHKEQMKALRAEVDVLTLTATPIPRTMGMALEGLRDLSVIATAPQRRLAIKTFVRTEANGVIRESVLRELKRAGRVYFLHNEVETIENRRAKLEDPLPEAIAVAHGQIPERENWAHAGMHDLEIRGAGEMLSEAVRCLKAGIVPDLLSPLNVTTDINLHAPTLLPDDYCGDVHLRLSFYKKLATAKTTDQVDPLLEEIVDRFGKLRPQAQTLIDVHRLRVLAKPYGVLRVDAAPGIISITFQKNPPIDPMKIIHLIHKHKHIKLAGNEKLRIERELPAAKDRAQLVRDILKSLGV